MTNQLAYAAGKANTGKSPASGRLHQVLARLTPWLAVIVACAAIIVGSLAGWYLTCGAIAAAAGYWAAWKLCPGAQNCETIRLVRHRAKEAAANLQEPIAPAVRPTATSELVDLMLEQGRCALLLRPEIAKNLSQDELHRAWQALGDSMAIVPEGPLVLGASRLDCDDPDEEDAFEPHVRIPVQVESLYLDRYPVTNSQYQAFLDGGGYEQPALWDPEVLPAVLDFVDQTGQPGPRFWKEGHYPDGEADYPVVGVSWFEACAYARWVGKRLPNEPEWEKSGCWPVSVAGTVRTQRRYPWGDAMDREKCNVWGSGPEQIVPVHQFPEGVSVGGVYQLVGNVWEWTDGAFCVWSNDSTELLATHLKSIRGGAYDTYFENQSTCQFASGEDPVVRKHNVGFRCALSPCDVSDVVETILEGAALEGSDLEGAEDSDRNGEDFQYADDELQEPELQEAELPEQVAEVLT